MKTPIYDFLKSYTAQGVSRFHMPGHKGIGPLGIEDIDITEIKGADVLYSSYGIIRESEMEAQSLFGSGRTLYSTEGSTLAIKAMLAIAYKCAGGKGKIIASRCAHKAFIYALAHLGAEPCFVYPEGGGHIASGGVTPSQIEQAISSLSEKPFGVYITSPDYLGGMADIEGIGKVCKKYGVPLLVDNAHGAYLAFASQSIHPIALGADMCCDSAHKTLPVLTGGAYLHISERAADEFSECAEDMLALFASTSPSYLTLASLDLCNKLIADGYDEKIRACIDRCTRLKADLSALGFSIYGDEPMKIVVKASEVGLCGEDIAAALRKNSVEPEFYDNDYLTLMPSPMNTEEDFLRVYRAFSSLSPCSVSNIGCEPQAHSFGALRAVMSIRDAILSPSEWVSAADSLGRICAEPCVSCPPAIPIAISGELIDPLTVSLFERYGVARVKVVK